MKGQKMLKLKNIKFNQALVGLSVFLGAILMIAGMVNGNTAAIAVNPETGIQQTTSLSEAQVLNAKYRNRIKMVEFTSNNNCLKTIGDFKFQKCYSVSKLKDVKWLRNAFSTIKRPVVIYAEQAEDRDYAASVLTYYGYKVQVLIEDALVPDNILNQSVSTVKQLVAQVDTSESTNNLDEVLTPVEDNNQVGTEEENVVSAEIEDEDEEDEEDEDEEEEEGC
jgi:hypothetical protein